MLFSSILLILTIKRMEEVGAIALCYLSVHFLSMLSIADQLLSPRVNAAQYLRVGLPVGIRL